VLAARLKLIARDKYEIELAYYATHKTKTIAEDLAFPAGPLDYLVHRSLLDGCTLLRRTSCRGCI
jgi:hypothetical protein